MYTPASVVEVRLADRLVGAVAENPASGFYAFEYAPEWVRGGVELAPFHMPSSARVFEFPMLARQTFYGLPAMLADALPDRFGNALVDAWMAEHGVPPNRITALDRLAYAADRGMGALTFRPPAGPADHGASAIDLADLVTVARARFAGEITDNESLQHLIQVGTSAGGARAKAVVAYNPATGQIRSGQFDAPHGFEHWLVKLDGVGTAPGGDAQLGATAPFGRIEYAYSLMATAAGVEMAETRLLLEGPRAHFLTRRFDRTDGERVHMQSLCALAHLDFNMARTHSYSSYMQAATRLGCNPAELNQAFRRVVFNVAAVNCDDHTKNLAFILRRGDRWRLAPAFDVTYSHNPSGEWTNAHQMSVEGKFNQITARDLRTLGDRWAVPAVDRTIKEVLDAVNDWPTFAQRASLPDHDTQLIGADIRHAIDEMHHR